MLGVLSFPPGKLKGARASGVCCLVCAVPWPGAGLLGGPRVVLPVCEQPPRPNPRILQSIPSAVSAPCQRL